MKRLFFCPKDRPISNEWIAPEADLRRMIGCLRKAGYVTSQDDLILAWKAVSSATCPTWRKLPRTNEKLLRDLLECLKTDAKSRGPVVAISRIEDAGDGTGDGIVVIPDEIVQALGWRESDILEVKALELGRIVVTKSI